MKMHWEVFLLFLTLAFAGVKGQAQNGGDVTRLDPAVNVIVPSGARLEKLAGNFGFLEGPVWVHDKPPGYLLFSDIPANVIDKWTPGGGVSVFLEQSGFTGADASDVGMEITNGYKIVTLIGSNAITLDKEGRIVFCQHGNRAIVRLDKNGQRTVLADRYEGKRLNSPNDLVYKSDGSLYFTDPPAGLRGGDKDPKKELPFDGVYRLAGGKLQLLSKDFTRPNGLAFSPGEKYLYVDDTTRKIIMRFDVQPDGGIAHGQVFIDMAANTAPGAPDGMKVDREGNVYCTGPGGIWIISADGKHLGTIKVPEIPANLAWGDRDGKTLYITARTGLYRIRLNVPGIRP